MISALVAVAILGIAALVLDRGYLVGAPGGTIQVDLIPIQALDAVVVVGKR